MRKILGAMLLSGCMAETGPVWTEEPYTPPPPDVYVEALPLPGPAPAIAPDPTVDPDPLPPEATDGGASAGDDAAVEECKDNGDKGNNANPRNRGHHYAYGHGRCEKGKPND